MNTYGFRTAYMGKKYKTLRGFVRGFVKNRPLYVGEIYSVFATIDGTTYSIPPRAMVDAIDAGGEMTNERLISLAE